MKYRLLFFILILPQFLFAQTDAKYLAGAVPLVNGKVEFKKKFQVPHLSEGEIYDSFLAWAKERFTGEISRVVYTDKEKGEIVAIAQEYLVFQSTFLSLDRSLTQYKVTAIIKGDICEVTLNGFRYEYKLANQDKPEILLPEELITDEHALNKKKTKLARRTGKFRRETIDLVDDLTKEIAGAFQKKEEAPKPEPKKEEVNTNDETIIIIPEKK